MTQRQKLIEKSRMNPAGTRFRFQDRKGMAKPYQVKQLLAVMDKYDLSGERG